jgi:hypothetical protein
LPRQLTYRGSRLVFSHGIEALAIIASILILVFNASVTALIPLYAIGVFLSFTLSQAGMARRWWKIGHLAPGTEVKERGSVLRFEANWRLKMLINGFGAVCTATVMMIFVATKFSDGAWVVLIIIPTLVGLFTLIHRHYERVAEHLSLENYDMPLRLTRNRVIVPMSSVHRGTLAALRYARTLSQDITAIHIAVEPADRERIMKKWEVWGDGIRLVVLDSPYRLLVEPLLQYIEVLDQERRPNEVITVVVPQFVPRRNVENALHMQTARILRDALLQRPGIVIIDVPYQIE